MSVPDDPFSGHGSTPPVVLHVHDTDQVDHAEQSVSTAVSGSDQASHTSSHHQSSLLLSPAHVSGTKTPRRVQWTSDSHIVSMVPEPRTEKDLPPLSPSQTIDHSNIEQINDALERHRRGHGPSTRSIEGGNNDGETRVVSQASIDEDYDYRLDTDVPQGSQLEATMSPTSGATGQVENSYPEAILENNIRDHVTEYIPLGETDGLPNLPQDTRNVDTATDLVRAHTGKWGVLRQRVRTAGSMRHALSTRNQPSNNASNDAEKQGFSAAQTSANPSINGVNGMPQIPGGTSVLSSLLALYGQQQGMGSEATTPASSRPPSSVGSYNDEDSSDDERRRRLDSTISMPSKSGRMPWSRKAPPSPLMFPERSNLQVNDHSEESAIGHRRNKSSNSIADREQSSPGLLGSFHRAVEHFREGDRPKAARSGAGVFGALIQNTGHMTAAATPHASTLVPAAKRSGYTLSRYSLQDVTSETSQYTGPWRPERSSRPQSRSGSRPASVHSSTVVEESPSYNDNGSTIAHAKSTEDLVTMKRKDRKPLGPLNLKSLEKLPVSALRESGHAFRNAEKWLLSAGRTPEEKQGDGYFPRPLTEDERRRKEWEAEKRRRKKAKEAKKKQEIFIIQHVAAILARQQFLMKLARSLMMFGSPSHRLETQIQATAKVLEINAQVVYLPGTMLLSFGDDATHTSETKFLKQATGLDLGKLLVTHNLYWDVVHDKISVDDASQELDRLMTTPVYYRTWQTIIIGAFCSAFIVVPSFYGSFIDALMCMPLGMLLVGVQMLAAKNDMFSNVFEIAIATLISFLSAVLSSTHYFCYTALVSGGVVLILPGYIVLCGALELASRNITAGAVRIGYSVIYSLFLGFGISIGAEIYTKIIGESVLNSTDYTCSNTHSGKPWYMETPSGYWYYLCVPGYSIALSLRNQQPLWAKELPIMVAISCAGWVTNHFSSLAFPGRSDIVSALGSFCVGILGNIYGRFSNGASFPVMVTGILFQLPSGLSQGGIFNFAADSTNGTADQYSEGFGVAEQLIAVAIGLTVGLFVAAVVTHPLGGSRRRGAGIFSF